MGYEFWGPRLPQRRKTKADGNAKPSGVDLTHSLTPPPASATPDIEDEEDPVTGEVLSRWDEDRRRQLEGSVDLDIWSRVKRQLPRED